LSADFSQGGKAVLEIESAGADWVHLDVMDGAFVPDITFGHKMVADLRPLTKLPLDVHLMVTEPARHIAAFAAAGADYITIHAEAAVHAHRLLCSIRELGKKVGIAIVPSTPLCAISEVLPIVDLELIMTVNTGYGGQALIPGCLDKVKALREIRAERGLSFLISVDGGIKLDTAPLAREAGVDVLVMGSAFFSARDKGAFVSLCHSL
jgi:ribulose-phosphate 3-epimerase